MTPGTKLYRVDNSTDSTELVVESVVDKFVVFTNGYRRVVSEVREPYFFTDLFKAITYQMHLGAARALMNEAHTLHGMNEVDVMAACSLEQIDEVRAHLNALFTAIKGYPFAKGDKVVTSSICCLQYNWDMILKYPIEEAKVPVGTELTVVQVGNYTNHGMKLLVTDGFEQFWVYSNHVKKV